MSSRLPDKLHLTVTDTGATLTDAETGEGVPGVVEAVVTRGNLEVLYTRNWPITQDDKAVLAHEDDGRIVRHGLLLCRRTYPLRHLDAET